MHNPATDRATPTPPAGQRAVALPLSVHEWATLHAPFLLTESAWQQMRDVLKAMKPALAAPSLPSPPPVFDPAPAPTRESDPFPEA